MRVPQVTDRLKEAPAQALRVVFSGVGSVLLVADRLRHRPGQETGQGNGHATRPATAQKGSSPTATAPAPYGGSPAAQGDPAAKAASSAKAARAAKARSAVPPAPRTPPAPHAPDNSPAPAKSSGGAATAALDGSGAAGGLPIAGYDGLTMPQLRARMRTLEPAQLRALIAHERAHAGRDEVVAMFERRIAKVESGG